MRATEREKLSVTQRYSHLFSVQEIKDITLSKY